MMRGSPASSRCPTSLAVSLTCDGSQAISSVGNGPPRTGPCNYRAHSWNRRDAIGDMCVPRLPHLIVRLQIVVGAPGLYGAEHSYHFSLSDLQGTPGRSSRTIRDLVFLILLVLVRILISSSNSRQVSARRRRSVSEKGSNGWLGVYWLKIRGAEMNLGNSNPQDRGEHAYIHNYYDCLGCDL